MRNMAGEQEEAAAYLEISVDLVVAAVAYYDVHQAEIDEWIEQNARERATPRTRPGSLTAPLAPDQRRAAAIPLSAPLSSRSKAA
jgi:hypothetical protein